MIIGLAQFRALGVFCLATVCGLAVHGTNIANAGAIAVVKTTDINGAQTFLNKNNGYQWTFTTTDNQLFQEIRGVFTLKTGPNTTENAVMKLFDSGNNLLGSATLAPSGPQGATQNFTDYVFSLVLAVGGPQPYNPEFQFTGGPYYLAMTSEANNTGSATWFIKPGDLVFEVLDGTQTNRGAYNGTGSPSGAPAAEPLPEPASLAVWGLACLGLAGAKRRLGLKKLANS